MEDKEEENNHNDGSGYSNLKPYAIQATGGSNNSRKPRKQYTMTKQRENWTDDEHQKFLEALKLFDRDWKKIENFIGTKTVIQIRSHAQKHFIKVQKNGTGEHVPPARPKRKSSQPYPKSKDETESNGQSPTWTPQSNEINPLANNPSAFAHWMASNGLLPNVVANSESPQAVEMQRRQQDQLQHAQMFLQETMSANQSRGPAPNFAKIYTFLGALFDPNAVNHSTLYSEMTSVDRETLQLLMHNLTVNLAHQHYKEQHSFLLDQYRSLLSKVQPDLNILPLTSTTNTSSSSTPITSPAESSLTSRSSSSDSPITPSSVYALLNSNPRSHSSSDSCKSSDDSNAETATNKSPD